MSGRDSNTQQRLLKFIDTEVETLHPSKSSAFIFRVPDELRNGNEPFFEPKTISIGPLHAHKRNLTAAEEMKKWYLKAFLSRLQQAQKTKYDVINLLISLESKTRECYKDMSTDDIVKIMLLDGCFIVELLLSHNEQQVSPESIFGKEEKVPLMILQQDLLKLENQLPFFIFHSLYHLIPSTNTANDRTLINAALNFFRIPIPLEPILERPRHLLELVMFALFPSSQTTIQVPPVPRSSLSKARSASELELYGIKFQPRYTTNLADVKFTNNGVLGIPRLEIQESTASLFWNILIFEMCSCEHRLFASYVVLMDTLVDNEHDVELLLRSGVLKTRINDKQRLVSLFNNLSANLQQKEFYFDSLVQQVNKCCESDIRPFRAYFIRNYYVARWDILNSVLLFILTVTQTLFSILAYNPKQK